MKTLDDALMTPGVIEPEVYSIGANDCFFEAKDGLIMISGYDLTPEILRRIADHLDPQPVAAPVIPEGWRLVPVEPDQWMRTQMDCGIEDGSIRKLWERALKAAPPAPLRTEAAVRAEARREVLEEAARAAENCDSPFNCPSDEQYEAVDLMARRIADTIRALIDQT